jgi:hypothetical protein
MTGYRALATLSLVIVACSSGTPGPKANESSGAVGKSSPSESTSAPVAGAKNSDGSSKTLDAPLPSQPGVALVLAYDDLGPQVMADSLIGPEWYSWATPGSFEPEDRFDVHVVVYEGDRAAIERRYATVKGHADYRLVRRAEAIKYLDAQLVELKDARDEVLVKLRARLESTRTRIIDALSATR